MTSRQSPRILIADDEPGNVELFSRMMRQLGYRIETASNGDDALDMVRRLNPDVVLLDVHMPTGTIDGFEVCRRIKADPATRLTPVVIITAAFDKLGGIEAGADDFVTKPTVRAELEARVRSLARLKRYTDELDSAEDVILNLGLMIEARDPGTQGHCQRLARYATALGAAVGLDEDQMVALHRGGYLHDVGKIAVPDAVLLKPGRLTPDEYEVIKRHTVTGDDLCSHLRLLDDVRPIVRHHHERPDGSGYPDGLKGDAIPLLARIISVVDVYDALRTVRPYKQGCTHEAAIDCLRAEAERGWKCPELVEVFASLTLPDVTGQQIGLEHGTAVQRWRI